MVGWIDCGCGGGVTEKLQFKRDRAYGVLFGQQAGRVVSVCPTPPTHRFHPNQSWSEVLDVDDDDDIVLMTSPPPPRCMRHWNSVLSLTSKPILPWLENLQNSKYSSMHSTISSH